MANTKQSTAKTQEQLEEAYHLAEQATTEAVGAVKEQAKEKFDVGAERVQQATKSAENVIKEEVRRISDSVLDSSSFEE